MIRWLLIAAGVMLAHPALSADMQPSTAWQQSIWDGRRETPSAPLQREIGPDRADSQCIGDATTPLCAVETFIACWARRDIDLCREVYDGPLRHFDAAGTQPYAFKYHLEAIYYPSGKEFPEARQPDWAAAGNAMVSMTNAPMSKDDDARKVWRNYLVEPTGDGWRIAYWTVYPDLPDGFPDGPAARRIERDDVAIPGCVEDANSTTCAVARFISCQIRETPICPGLGWITIPADAIRATAVEYRDIVSYRFRPEDVPDETVGNIKPRPGDIFYGTAEKLYLDDRVARPASSRLYLLRPALGGWNIVSVTP